jgi:hypothetical protein
LDFFSSSYSAVHTFVDFMPSEVALSAFAAAASIAYPKNKIAKDIKRMMSPKVCWLKN